MDRVARRYSTDPGAVLRWDALRLSLAVEAMRAGEQVTRMTMAREKDKIMAVVDVARL